MKVSLLASAACIAFATSMDAATIRYVGPNDGSWHEPDNWTIDGAPAERVPSSDDDDYVQPDGRTIRIAEAATFRQFATSLGGGTIHIDDGGSMTGTQPYAVRYATINVHSGGWLSLGAGWEMRSPITIDEGGEVTGGNRVGSNNETRTLPVNGTWSPRGTTLAAGTTIIVGPDTSTTRYGRVELGATGTIILDLYGNGTNEYFEVRGPASGNRLWIDQGTIQLRLQGGYEPQPGHSFALWTLAEDALGSLQVGDGSNIVVLDHPEYKLDTSLWATEGIVAVKPATTATVLMVH